MKIDLNPSIGTIKRIEIKIDKILEDIKIMSIQSEVCARIHLEMIENQINKVILELEEKGLETTYSGYTIKDKLNEARSHFKRVITE